MNLTKFRKWAGIVLLCVFIPFAAWAILIDSNGTNQSVKTPFTILSGNSTSDLHIKGTSGGIDAVIESNPAGLQFIIPGGGSLLLSSKVLNSGDYVTTLGKYYGDGSGLSNLLSTVTQVFNNVYTTNEYVDVINNLSNAFITINTSIKVTGQAQFNNIVITNSLFWLTNAWPNGPTGAVSMAIHKQNYSTLTPVSVTGITSKSNNVTEEVLLSIANTSSSNITFTMANGIVMVYGGAKTNQGYISPGGVGEAWIHYNPDRPHTNAVLQDL